MGFFIKNGVHPTTYAYAQRRCDLYFREVSSPTGLNAQLCCTRFDLPLSSLTSINRNSVWCNVFLQLDAHCSTVSVIRHMLCIKSSQAEIAGFTSYDVDFVLRSVCVSLLFVYYFY